MIGRWEEEEEARKSEDMGGVQKGEIISGGVMREEEEF